MAMCFSDQEKRSSVRTSVTAKNAHEHALLFSRFFCLSLTSRYFVSFSRLSIDHGSLFSSRLTPQQTYTQHSLLVLCLSKIIRKVRSSEISIKHSTTCFFKEFFVCSKVLSAHRIFVAVCLSRLLVLSFFIWSLSHSPRSLNTASRLLVQPPSAIILISCNIPESIFLDNPFPFSCLFQVVIALHPRRTCHLVAPSLLLLSFHPPSYSFIPRPSFFCCLGQDFKYTPPVLSSVLKMNQKQTCKRASKVTGNQWR